METKEKESKPAKETEEKIKEKKFKEKKEIVTIPTRNGVEIEIPKSLSEQFIEKGCFLKLYKKKKDIYCYFSKRTIGTLLLLSKRNKPYQLDKLMSKEEFVEFYYDLKATDLMYVFWIGEPGKAIFELFDDFLYERNFDEENLSKELKNFYEFYSNFDIGLYSTEESFFKYHLLNKYTISTSIKEKRSEENIEVYGLYDNFIKSETLFVKNQIADDILKEYILDFEYNDLQFSKDKYIQLDNTFSNLELNPFEQFEKIVKTEGLTLKETKNRIPKPYLQYKLLISRLDCIFGKYYETYGNIMRINDVSIFDNPKELIETKYPIEQIRIYELLLSLQKDKYINIHDIAINVKNKQFVLSVEFNYSPESIVKINKKRNNIKYFSFDKLFKYNKENNELFYGNIRIIPDKEGNTPPPAYFKTLLYLLETDGSSSIDDVYNEVMNEEYDAVTNPHWVSNCVTRINTFLIACRHELTRKDEKITLRKRKEPKKIHKK